MRTTNLSPRRPAEIVLSVLVVITVAATLAVVAVVLLAGPSGTDAPESGATLIPPACATIDPEAFPCALPSMGVRW